jgi:hypothetical protein
MPSPQWNSRDSLIIKEFLTLSALPKEVTQNLKDRDSLGSYDFYKTYYLLAGKAHLEKIKSSACKEKLLTCIEFRAVDCTHNWIQFPALKQTHKNAISTFDSTTFISAKKP